MWRKRSRPTPEELAPRDDLNEARAALAEAQSGIVQLNSQASFIRHISAGLIDRQGKNHYIDLLYQHVPRGTA